MKVSIQPTSATHVDAAAYGSVTQSVTVVPRAASTPRRPARSAPRRRTAPHRKRADVDGLVEVTLVRSSRNRLGGGARARPAAAQ